METDVFFFQLFKHLPQTLFDLIGLPAANATHYRFDSVEVKKSFRIDGLFLPDHPSLPVMFLEVQFQQVASFYANLFAKVFLYLQENDPTQDWLAVAIFENRAKEPRVLTPYEDLLQSTRVRRVYLEDHPIPTDPPLGLGLVQLMMAPEPQVKSLVDQLVRKASCEISDSDRKSRMIELVEELLMRRFGQLSRDEVRAMIHLGDLSKSRAWQEYMAEARQEGLQKGIQEGLQEGRQKGRQEGENAARAAIVKKWLAKGMAIKQIAELLELPVKDIRRLAKLNIE